MCVALGLWWLGAMRAGTRSVPITLPAPPDTSRLPEELTRRIATTHATLTRADAPLASLGELARLYYANGFHAEAAPLVDHLITAAPDDPRWPYYAADLAQQEGNIPAALAHLETTLRRAPDDPAAHLKRAELLLKIDRPDEAAPHYLARLRSIPADPYAALGLARVALARGDSTEARTRLERLTTDHPDFPAAWNLLATLVDEAGDTARADALRRRGQDAGRFREAPDRWFDELHPWCFDPYRLEVLGAIRMQSGDPAAALPLLERALRLAPNDVSIHDSLADVYTQLDRFDDARRTLETGIAAAPAEPRLPIRLAELLLRLGRRDDALRIVADTLARIPDSPELHNQHGVVLDALGRSDEAVRAYREALRLQPGQPEAMLNLGKSLLATDEAAGFALVSRALELRPNRIDALVLLADRETTAGRLDAALPYVDALVRLAPHDPGVRTVVASWHLRRGSEAARAGRVDEALTAFRTGLSFDPELPELHGNLGVVLVQADRYAEALPAFERLVVLAPDNATGHLYLGGVLVRLDRTPEARRVFERGLATARKAGDATLERRLRDVLARLPADSPR